MPPKRPPRTGDIWNIRFDPQVGREQAGSRPALVISSDWYNDWLDELYIVVPITTRDRGLAFHVRTDPPDGGLSKISFAMCEQVKSQSVDRFEFRRRIVSDHVLRSVQEIVATLIER